MQHDNCVNTQKCTDDSCHNLIAMMPRCTKTRFLPTVVSCSCSHPAPYPRAHSVRQPSETCSCDTGPGSKFVIGHFTYTGESATNDYVDGGHLVWRSPGACGRSRPCSRIGHATLPLGSQVDMFSVLLVKPLSLLHLPLFHHLILLDLLLCYLLVLLFSLLRNLCVFNLLFCSSLFVSSFPFASSSSRVHQSNLDAY